MLTPFCFGRGPRVTLAASSRGGRHRGERGAVTAELALTLSFADRIVDLGRFGSVADLAWTIDMLLGGGTLAIDRTPAFRYRRHAESHSSVGAKGVQRYDEEQSYYAYAAKQLKAAGWTKAARAARLHFFCRGHLGKSTLDSVAARDFKLAGQLAKRAVKIV